MLTSPAWEYCSEDWTHCNCSEQHLLLSKWHHSKYYYYVLISWKHLQGKGWILHSFPRFSPLASLMYPTLGLLVGGRGICQESHHFIAPSALSALTPEMLGSVMTARPPHHSHNAFPPSFQCPMWKTPILLYCLSLIVLSLLSYIDCWRTWLGGYLL